MSGSSVSENDEQNIIERLLAFQADGFIGFYSTIASAGLNTRLYTIRKEGKIKDYYIFDHKEIENHLVTVGYSHLMLRYFPHSYENFRPLHLVTDKYEPLECDSCGKDLLKDLFTGEYTANLARLEKRDPTTGKLHIHDVYCACKGECDKKLQSAGYQAGYLAPWIDISDLVIPIEFLRYVFATMNRIREGMDIYSDEAYSKEKKILIKISQKVLRFTTEIERARFKELLSLPW